MKEYEKAQYLQGNFTELEKCLAAGAAAKQYIQMASWEINDIFTPMGSGVWKFLFNSSRVA